MNEILSLHFIQSGEIFSMQENKITVGTAKNCDLMLSDKHFNCPPNTISRRHFKITKSSDGFILTDLRSTNGTQINNDVLQVNEPYFLRDDDIITLARNDKYQIKVEIGKPYTEIVPTDDEQPSGNQTKSELRNQDRAQSYKPRSLFDFDEDSARFVVDGHAIPVTHFTELENDLLRYLYKNAERVCSYYDITKYVWKGWVSSNNIISSAIGRIRKKLNKISTGAGGRYIKTKTGFGYMLTRNNNY